MIDRDPTPRACARHDVMAIEPSALERAFLPAFLFGGDAAAAYALDASGVATVAVDGPLEPRASWLWDGYDAIAARFAAALADPRTQAVVLRVASPGGAVAGMLDAAAAMRAAADAAGTPVVTYADGAYSAGYALAVVGDEIVVGATSGVGSIGVITTMTDATAALAKDGLDVAVIASGAHKTDGHPGVARTDAATARTRARVGQLAQAFAAHVATRRGTTADAVLALQAATYLGADAVAAGVGLADHVGTHAFAAQRARALAAARTSARQAAAAAAQGPPMKSLLAVLGLAETATEAEGVARATASRETERALCALTGTESPTAALVAVHGWKAAGAKLAQAEAELATRVAAERDAHVADVMAAQHLAEAMRAPLALMAKTDWDGFRAQFPRPSGAELAQRAQDAARTQRPVPAAAGGAPRAALALVGEEPSAEQLKTWGLTRESYAAAQTKMRDEGVL